MSDRVLLWPTMYARFDFFGVWRTLESKDGPGLKPHELYTLILCCLEILDGLHQSADPGTPASGKFQYGLHHASSQQGAQRLAADGVSSLFTPPWLNTQHPEQRADWRAMEAWTRLLEMLEGAAGYAHQLNCISRKNWGPWLVRQAVELDNVSRMVSSWENLNRGTWDWFCQFLWSTLP